MTTVLLSGGMDSAVALYWARLHRESVRALALDYGQRHQRELVAARMIAERADVPFELHRMVIPWAPMRGAVIPGRNAHLLTIAATHSYAHETTCEVVVGACLADAQAFPDCRSGFLESQARSLSLGLGTDVAIFAPLIELTKAQTVKLARELGAWDALSLSWSCYLGGERPCGDCSACRFRIEGFREAGEVDPWRP